MNREVLKYGGVEDEDVEWRYKRYEATKNVG